MCGLLRLPLLVFSTLIVAVLCATSFDGNAVCNETDDTDRVPHRQQLKLIQVRSVTGKRDVHGGNAVTEVCGVKLHVNLTSTPYERCPQECPFFAEDLTAPRGCTFQCVPDSGCRGMNPAKPIADAIYSFCRSCSGAGCSKCDIEHPETCLVCEKGHTLYAGKCFSDYQFVWTIVFSVVGAILVALIVWIVNLARCKINNAHIVQHGLKFRKRCQFHRVLDDGGPFSPGRRCSASPGSTRERWPLTTNLCREDVGGAGLILHFNFQLWILVWAATITVAWVILGFATSTELFALGLERTRTPRDYCVVTIQGYDAQQRLMWAKCGFVIGVYVFSFSMALVFAGCQAVRFEKLDDDETTMQDFAAVCKGLPELPGSEPWEERLKARLERLVGVSVCWDYRARLEEVRAALKDLEDRKDLRKASVMPADDDAPGCCSGLRRAESALLARITGSKAAWSPADSADLVASLRSTDVAIAVFATEGGRDDAVEAVRKSAGVTFETGTLRLAPVAYEPASVIFQNFSLRRYNRVFRLFIGVLVILFALGLWTSALFFPYAHYVLAASYVDGHRPSAVQSATFSLLIVLGNQVMYCVCRGVAEQIGFVILGSLEACYVVLYCLAILFNILADTVVTFRVAFLMVAMSGTRTHDGTPIASLSTIMGLFETYPMQKGLGWLLFRYSFPATFLLPYLFEPLFVYVLPVCLTRLLVRCHPEVRRSDAETCFKAPTMDLGRYADIIVNVFLVVLTLYFPGGYVLLMFGALTLSHMYIYAYDHFRLLRVVPTFCVSSRVVDNWSQALLSIPVGILLACAVYKANCQGRLPCTSEGTLAVRVCTAFWCHVAVHLFLLLYVLPSVFKKSHKQSEVPFEQCAKSTPCSWFTANPVHCLRSEFFYEHSPACQYYVVGKEHLQSVNPDIGCFFSDSPSR